MTQVDELTGALNDAQQKTIEFYSSEKREFKPLIHKCVWNLLSMHVSFENISKVVVTVLKMCGMTYDRLPSESTMRNMNKDRILVSQVQVASKAAKTASKTYHDTN